MEPLRDIILDSNHNRTPIKKHVSWLLSLFTYISWVNMIFTRSLAVLPRLYHKWLFLYYHLLIFYLIFIDEYNTCESIHSYSIPSNYSPVPLQLCPPNFMCFLIFNQVYFAMCMCMHRWPSIGAQADSRTASPKKTDSPSSHHLPIVPFKHIFYISPSPICAGTVAGLTLCKFFMCVLFFLCELLLSK